MASTIGPKPSLQWLPVDLLRVDPRYQRSIEQPASKRLISRIAENFHWAKFQAVLAIPDAPVGWLLIDGQHRVAAARERGLAEVPAVVIENASIADQAAAFIGANRERIAISAQGMLRARVVAGEPDAVRLQQICDQAGITLLPYNLSNARSPIRHTPAAAALVAIYRTYGDGPTEGAVKAVAKAFLDVQGALRGIFFRGAAKAIYDGADPEMVTAALMRLGVGGLEHFSYQLGTMSATAVIAAKLLTESKAPPAPHPKRAAVADPERKPREAADGGIAVDRAGDAHAADRGLGPARAQTKPAPPVDRPAGQREKMTGPPGQREGGFHPSPQDDEAAIVKFITERGTTVVLSPEQIAAFLRDAGYQATIREAEQTKRPSANVRWKAERQAYLDGKPVEMSEFYDVANKLRVEAGLRPVSPPARPA